jgi:hypothetical protein
MTMVHVFVVAARSWLSHVIMSARVVLSAISELSEIKWAFP